MINLESILLLEYFIYGIINSPNQFNLFLNLYYINIFLRLKCHNLIFSWQNQFCLNKVDNSKLEFDNKFIVGDEHHLFEQKLNFMLKFWLIRI